MDWKALKAALLTKPPKFNAEGLETPDPRPMAVPFGSKRPETLQEQIQRLVRNQVSSFAAQHERETFEEANDFDIPDDDPTGLHTEHTAYTDLIEEVLNADATADIYPGRTRGGVDRSRPARNSQVSGEREADDDSPDQDEDSAGRERQRRPEGGRGSRAGASDQDARPDSRGRQRPGAESARAGAAQLRGSEEG